MKPFVLPWPSKVASYVIVALVIVAGGLWTAPPAAAQAYHVDKKTEGVPSQLSTAVRAILSPNAVVVSGPKGELCEIWMRRLLPVVAQSGQLGVTFARIQPGTLVGAIRFRSGVTDYRNQSVPAGVYTLRYNVTPVDGNHQGVAPQRDFLLLVPAADDQDSGTLTPEQTIALSRKSTTTNHPSVWSVGPVDPAAVSLPAMENHQDDDSWDVDFAIPTEDKSVIRMSLVVVGHSANI